jgi:carotenoid cleavage dioxygenase
VTSQPNEYLTDNYGPVREELTVADLAVTGAIPDYLDGRYLRIGPNPVHPPNHDDYHWFLGDGMVHGVRIDDGEAKWYRNRYVRNADVSAALGEPARPGPVHAGFDFAANTNVIGHAGQTLALVESGARPYALTDELDTIGPCDFDGTLRGGYTAHPHLDAATGELHAVSYYWGWGNQVEYSVRGTDGRIRHRVNIKVHGSPMIHDFSLTENYVVIYDLPVSFDINTAVASVPRPMRIAAKASMRAFVGRRRLPESVSAAMARTSGGGSPYSAASFPYRWNPDYPARVGVMPRNGRANDIRWYDVEPCYVFHPLNAYEDGDSIVLDVVRHPKCFASRVDGPDEGTPTMERWTVDTSAGKVREERIDDRGQEFPRINERLTGRRHRYGYAVGVGSTADEGRVIKHDLVAGTTQDHDFGPGVQNSEFVFVPRPGKPNDDSATEDDGVLMGYTYDRAADRSNLVMLDAASLEIVASIQLPARVPQGFHGNWVAT